ncbi:hypothetical protein AYI68_g5978 [Smittium mucronatum]|uniref:CCHC-type domain-containing protein n=1 Tax=Smittium mucronatum TaxID=133383 RepID=A0A1R0GSW4_9FUNG|nr:hypothetical protein AYI68_g5978 [Smittium mucronatum]
MSTTVPSTDIKGIKLPAIEKFGGAPGKYSVFMAAIKRQFWVIPEAFSTFHAKIAFLSVHLTDSTALWFSDLMDSEEGVPTNYAKFLYSFQNHFADSSYQYRPSNRNGNYPQQTSIHYNPPPASRNHETNIPSYYPDTNLQPGAPMEIYAVQIRPRGPLSFEEKNRRMQNGLCLYCGSEGHIVKECRICPHALKAKPQK